MSKKRVTTSREKDLKYYLNLPYPITLYPAGEGGYVAEIRDLPGCLTQGETAAETLELIEDAKRGWLEVALEDGSIIPEPATHSYSGRFVVRLPKSLHRQLAEAAEREDVSLNQYVLFLLAGRLASSTATAGRTRPAARRRAG